MFDLGQWRETDQFPENKVLIVAWTGGNRYNKTIMCRPGSQPKALVDESGICFESEPGDFASQDDGIFKRVKTVGRPSKTWDDRAWYPSAKGQKPFEVRDLCGGDSGKAFFALPTLVSQLWSEIRDGDLIVLTTVVHNLFVLKDEMIEELQGLHRVQCDGVVKTFTIEVVSVLTEGVGALLSLKKTPREVKANDRVALFDGGGDTLNLSFFNGYKLDGSAASELGLGANFIIGEMQTGAHGVSRILNRNPHNTDESLSLLVRRPKSASPEDHAAMVKALLICWLTEVKKTVNEKHSRKMATANRIIFTGGLTQSPQFSESLRSAGFYPNCEVIKSGQIADTKGIFDRLVQSMEMTECEMGRVAV